MSIQDHFNTILNSKTLYQLADSLDFLLDLFTKEQIRKKQKRLEELRHMLSVRIFYTDQSFDSFIRIYSEPESVLEFFFNSWNWKNSYKENKEQLQSITNKIRNEMIPADTDGLSDHTIHELMDLVQARFKFESNVLCKKPLKILQFSQSHHAWDCYYNAALSGGTLTRDCIIMTRPHNHNTRQEFGFVHELGHRLHTSLTNKLFVPPASFSCFNHFYEDTDKMEDAVKAECFADAFAIAALSNSPYQDCIPFEVEEEKINLYSYYFFITIMTMNENIVHDIDDLYRIINQINTLL